LTQAPFPDGHTLRNVRRDFVEWHLGRPCYAVWAIDADIAPVRRRVADARAHLAGFLLDDYRRQPHVTLGLCGFPVLRPLHADDFGMEALQAQVRALQHLRPQAFEIGIGGLHSFTSAPYLGVSDPGGRLSRLCACLHMSAGADRVTIPHVTVGLYADAWPAASVQARLECPPRMGTLRLQVRHIALLSYVAADIDGPLTELARYDFDRARLQMTSRFPLQDRDSRDGA
jgi:hypothetical protein